jgi:hypothetical protein
VLEGVQYMDFYSHFPYFLVDLDEIRYKMWAEIRYKMWAKFCQEISSFVKIGTGKAAL